MEGLHLEPDSLRVNGVVILVQNLWQRPVLM